MNVVVDHNISVKMDEKTKAAAGENSKEKPLKQAAK